LRQQFLDHDLGLFAVRGFRVALDERNRIGLYLVSIELEIKLHATIHLLGKFGANSGIGEYNADFDLLRQSRAA
jgi:hypothetical protein